MDKKSLAKLVVHARSYGVELKISETELWNTSQEAFPKLPSWLSPVEVKCGIVKIPFSG